MVDIMPIRATTIRTRGGYSLLEVIAASALMALALVPALEIMRDGMRWSRDVDTREKLLLYGVSKLEEHTALAAASWTPSTVNGDFAGDGHANVRYAAVRSDDPSDGGLTDQLMSITVTTYLDEDGDDTFDAGEPNVVVATKIGKFVSYESEAGS
jgi:hypothetical protein